ncbi:MAG: hypothetical protein OXH00_21625 [Candidatus Poribacteria bacterium]|nr:hypothetical protein [Candidatus Poribacteria bacterium]
MGSRNYIGRLREDNQVEFVYCHKGAYMEENGKALLEHYTDTEAVKSLIAGGAMASLGADGVPFYDGDKGENALTMPLAAFQAYEDISIESLFLFSGGAWQVKSGWHIEFCSGRRWHKLSEVVKHHNSIAALKAKKAKLQDKGREVLRLIADIRLEVEFLQGNLLTEAEDYEVQELLRRSDKLLNEIG